MHRVDVVDKLDNVISLLKVCGNALNLDQHDLRNVIGINVINELETIKQEVYQIE